MPAWPRELSDADGNLEFPVQDALGIIVKQFGCPVGNLIVRVLSNFDEQRNDARINHGFWS